MDELKRLYLHYTGFPADEIRELRLLSGSNRHYFRLIGKKNVIGVYGASAAENNAFIYMAGHFREKRLPMPAVHCHSGDKLYYLQEDLGDTLLFDAIEKGRQNGTFNERERMILHKTISWLPSIQIKGAEGFDFSQCYPQPTLDARSILWDLNYFKYCFLKATGLDFMENRLEDDFSSMCKVLLQDEAESFLYRDFQSRNVIIQGGEPYFIDFQGGRKGPVYYDVASFLWQAKARFSKELKDELLISYIRALRAFLPVDEAAFRHRLRHFVLFRLLQVLGAYGFRGYFEKKTHFIQSVPLAIDNLRELLIDDFEEYPYLCDLLRKMTAMKQFADARKKRLLEVKIISFAYKKGIPDDSSGNGGGYVFDCRAIHNPGRYERYSLLTGLDEPVVRFLEEKSDVSAFLNHVDILVDASVKQYLDRGFTNLMVSFGCTGGQHRSVYCARHLAEHLHKKFGIGIHLIHREQNIEQNFKTTL